eukprot:TRINITY_DN15387_c0_g1_i2.p2 TRINITY_DN15387_c0_g1~~TRINITY_DN15387_c0_g1_i2.p2  ORF type:complete len:402 (-),score=95.21 TRINITY_DN15387_c0_g1_i2:1356-2561(-)
MMMLRSKIDEDYKPVEQEIVELQRKFRVLENDKRAYSEDSQGIIRKQRATIEKMTRENKKMKTEIAESRAFAGSGPELKMANEGLKKLTNQKEQLLVNIEAEEENCSLLGNQLDTKSKNIMSVRQEMAAHGGCNAAIENAKAVQKQIRVLENRLDHALQNFNVAVCANKKLRNQIDTLRVERTVFDDIYRKLEAELVQKKKEMASIIEQANAAYEARDSAQAQMASLKQQADKEHSEFEKEWRELGRLIENDKRMKDFMRDKANGIMGGKTRSVIAQERKAASQKNWDVKKPSNITSNAVQDRVQSYEEAFLRIQASTGICDIDELVQTFINAEDQNYSFFKYNNLLSEDIEKMEQEIALYKQEQIALSGAFCYNSVLAIRISASRDSCNHANSSAGGLEP